MNNKFLKPTLKNLERKIRATATDSERLEYEVGRGLCEIHNAETWKEVADTWKKYLKQFADQLGATPGELSKLMNCYRIKKIVDQATA